MLGSLGGLWHEISFPTNGALFGFSLLSVNNDQDLLVGVPNGGPNSTSAGGLGIVLKIPMADVIANTVNFQSATVLAPSSVSSGPSDYGRSLAKFMYGSQELIAVGNALAGKVEIRDPNNLSTTLTLSFAVNSRAGTAIGNIGDATGDGIDDIAIGAPGNGSSSVLGQVFIFDGFALGNALNSNLPPPSPIATLNGQANSIPTSPKFGYSLDGLTDPTTGTVWLIVGEPRSNKDYITNASYSNQSGEAIVFTSSVGPQLNFTVLTNFAGGLADTEKGTAVELAIDNGAVIGAFGTPYGMIGSVSAFQLSDTSGVPLQDPVVRFFHNQAGVPYGGSLNSFPSVFGSGFVDLFVGNAPSTGGTGLPLTATNRYFGVDVLGAIPTGGTTHTPWGTACNTVPGPAVNVAVNTVDVGTAAPNNQFTISWGGPIPPYGMDVVLLIDTPTGPNLPPPPVFWAANCPGTGIGSVWSNVTRMYPSSGGTITMNPLLVGQVLGPGAAGFEADYYAVVYDPGPLWFGTPVTDFFFSAGGRIQLG